MKKLCPHCNSETDWMPHGDLWSNPPNFKEGDFCYQCEKNVTPIVVEVAETDCRTETGVTVGLIDAIITMSRLLAQRDLAAPEIQEALKDLRQDEDLAKVLHG